MNQDRDSDLLKTMGVMATRAERKGKLRKEPQAVWRPAQTARAGEGWPRG